MSLINRNSGSPIFNTLAEAQASNMDVGQLPIVLGTSGAFDGGGIIYSVQPNGSGGVSMSNGNELVKYTGTAAVLDVMTDLSDPASGSLMPPGAFGIGSDQAVRWSTTNLDDITVNGFYDVDGADTGKPSDAAPLGGQLIHINVADENNATQMFFTVSLTSSEIRIYRRQKIIGTWSAWKRIDPQAFGLGGESVAPPSTDADTLDDDSTFFYSGAWTNTPVSYGYLQVYAAPNSGYAKQVFTVTALSTGSENRIFERNRYGGGGAGWTEWVEIYHTGNLNTLEFTSPNSNDIVAFGWASSSTSALFPLPVSLSANPSSITVTGTFAIGNPAGVIVFSGKTPVISTASSNKACIVSVPGLSGLTIGQNLTLITEGSTAKITVNP